ncbi:hypothetical protein C8Q78DRAFT_990161 [Trametes maxima]|nr:hypothetical protein C8Q78DRAFT_990161 [Trametes maxima]
MDKVPVELLTLISFYACTDGGQTGCALSLVSRRIREASRPARFYSIALTTSPAQIQPFLGCLEKERSRSRDMRPRVRHLCLSLFGRGLETSPHPSSALRAPLGQNFTTPTPAPAPGPADPAPTPDRPKTRAEFLASLQRRTQHWRAAQDGLDEQYGRVIPALIRAVAPDVHTLALIQVQWRSGSAGLVRGCSFPALRELTLLGGDPSFLPLAPAAEVDLEGEDEDEHAGAEGGRPLFPVLRRLHHILAWVNRDVDFTQWAAHAPNVTHLRVSRMDSHPQITVSTLERVLSREGVEVGFEAFFPHLQRAIIEPHPEPPPEARMSTAHAMFLEFLDYLQGLRERARVPLTVLPPCESSKPALDQDVARQRAIPRVKRTWLERVEGTGVGCWVE